MQDSQGCSSQLGTDKTVRTVRVNSAHIRQSRPRGRPSPCPAAGTPPGAPSAPCPCTRASKPELLSVEFGKHKARRQDNFRFLIRHASRRTVRTLPAASERQRAKQEPLTIEFGTHTYGTLTGGIRCTRDTPHRCTFRPLPPASERQRHGRAKPEPPTIEFGTHKTVEAIFWPWLEASLMQKSSSPLSSHTRLLEPLSYMWVLRPQRFKTRFVPG